ncbi:hypothetical protein HMPREF1267_00394 [Corynebacterium sp. KPL1824]|nr:hypothetical protein HMPREF1267_00394 [Corynebacterium sp. KPL1824]
MGVDVGHYRGPRHWRGGGPVCQFIARYRRGQRHRACSTPPRAAWNRGLFRWHFYAGVELAALSHNCRGGAGAYCRVVPLCSERSAQPFSLDHLGLGGSASDELGGVGRIFPLHQVPGRGEHLRGIRNGHGGIYDRLAVQYDADFGHQDRCGGPACQGAATWTARRALYSSPTALRIRGAAAGAREEETRRALGGASLPMPPAARNSPAPGRSPRRESTAAED